MKKLVLVFIFMFSCGLCQHAANIEIKGITAAGQQYKTIRLRFEANLGFDNPFDLITNQVLLKINRPDFSSAKLSFFYDGKNDEGIECWEVRFTPKLSGKYLFQVII